MSSAELFLEKKVVLRRDPAPKVVHQAGTPKLGNKMKKTNSGGGWSRVERCSNNVNIPYYCCLPSGQPDASSFKGRWSVFCCYWWYRQVQELGQLGCLGHWEIAIEKNVPLSIAAGTCSTKSKTSNESSTLKPLNVVPTLAGLWFNENSIAPTKR